MAELSSDSTPKYKQYHPYQHIDPNSPHIKLYNIPTSPEHLFEEQAYKTRRNISENLTFYTGTSFFLGSIFGGVKGTISGLSSAEYGESVKIRASRVLNTGGLTGRKVGNAAGILGLMYAVMYSAVVYKRDVDDALTYGLAGMGTGALYRAPGGVRAMVVAGILGGVGVNAAVYGKELLSKYVNVPR